MVVVRPHHCRGLHKRVATGLFHPVGEEALREEREVGDKDFHEGQHAGQFVLPAHNAPSRPLLKALVLHVVYGPMVLQLHKLSSQIRPEYGAPLDHPGEHQRGDASKETLLTETWLQVWEGLLSCAQRGTQSSSASYCLSKIFATTPM